MAAEPRFSAIVAFLLPGLSSLILITLTLFDLAIGLPSYLTMHDRHNIFVDVFFTVWAISIAYVSYSIPSVNTLRESVTDFRRFASSRLFPNRVVFYLAIIGSLLALEVAYWLGRLSPSNPATFQIQALGLLTSNLLILMGAYFALVTVVEVSRRIGRTSFPFPKSERRNINTRGFAWLQLELIAVAFLLLVLGLALSIGTLSTAGIFSVYLATSVTIAVWMFLGYLS